ncbi:MAG TPA: COR domain-containing protein [Chthoniobacteraceae bacterium]|nr:COR domain-containing protein [Chthoniobacteraceae bacterium]
MKLIFVGRGEVGKSSMVDVLQGKKFVKDRARTDGVAITTWPLDLPDGKAKVLMWDFGGQEIMHGTHQFFLTHRSLYVVMVDGRHDRGKQDAEYWLKLVRAFGGESTVLIVMNRQRAHPFDLDRQYLADKYGVKLEHFFRTDCERPEEIAPLRAAIEEEAARMLAVEERFPVKCWEVKAWLGEMKTKGKDYLSDEEYAAICAQRGVADGGEQQKLLRRLADLGTVVSFPEDVKLAALSVLNPEWATDGIYRVVTNEALRELRHGRLARAALRELLPRDRWPQAKHVQYMLDLMEKFELCFAVAEGDGAVLVPELLPDKTPPLADWDAARCVVFLYEYPVLPHGVLPRFTTRTHTLSEGRERWRSGVVLADDGAEALIKADYDANLVSVWVRGDHADARRALLKVVRHHFEHIHARIKNLQPRELVSVPEHPEVTVPYRDLVLDERAGVRTTRVTIAGARVEMEIALLLNGVESPAERAGAGDRLERAPIHVHGNYIEHMTTDDHSSHITARDITNSQVGQTLTNCQNMVQQQPPSPQKELLTTLTSDVDQLVKQLPAAKADEAPQVAENLELLVKQATSAKPNRKWYDLSTEGLLEASKWVKDFTGNIAGTIGQLGKLLWPGYALPGAGEEKEGAAEKEKKKIG